MSGITEASLRRFSNDLQRFGSLLLPQQLVEFHQKVVLQILNGVIFKTPVDTGRARGGWQVTINFVPTAETGIMDKGGSATFENGVSVLNGLTPFSVVYITNNVEYIIPLEEGHSKQAPQGMIALTLEEVRQQFAA